MPPQQRVKLVNYLLSNKNLLENLKKGVGLSNQTENNESENTRHENHNSDTSEKTSVLASSKIKAHLKNNQEIKSAS